MKGKNCLKSNKKDKHLCLSLTNSMQDLCDKSYNTIEGKNGKFKNGNLYHIAR